MTKFPDALDDRPPLLADGADAVPASDLAHAQAQILGAQAVLGERPTLINGVEYGSIAGAIAAGCKIITNYEAMTAPANWSNYLRDTKFYFRSDEAPAFDVPPLVLLMSNQRTSAGEDICVRHVSDSYFKLAYDPYFTAGNDASFFWLAFEPPEISYYDNVYGL
jgi:hypothetical protein